MTLNLTTDPETFKVIDKVLRQLYGKFNFDNFDSDDMYQVGYMIAIKALPAYDSTKGTTLSTFLYGVLCQRYINFIRDNSVRTNNHCKEHTSYNDACQACKRRQATQDKKRGIQKPRDLDGLDFQTSGSLDEVEIKELEKKINSKLPKELRSDYLLMKDGIHVSKSRRDEIESFIMEIINE
jgi:DNA-directed RNA polymerase specialized sigma subunit